MGQSVDAPGGALSGSLCDMATCAQGCLVLEEIIRTGSSANASRMAWALCAEARNLAQHANGSSVLCRLLEHAAADGSTEALMDAVLFGNGASLCCHKYGHEVAMSILSNGQARHRRAIVAALFGNLQRSLRHRFASSVIVQALTLCPPEECEVLATHVLQEPGAIVALCCHTFGVHVVRALLETPQWRGQVVHQVSGAWKRISKDKYGRAVLEELELSVTKVARPLPLDVLPQAILAGA